jgi:hypothetical protein
MQTRGSLETKSGFKHAACACCGRLWSLQGRRPKWATRETPDSSWTKWPVFTTPYRTVLVIPSSAGLRKASLQETWRMGPVSGVLVPNPPVGVSK